MYEIPSEFNPERAEISSLRNMYYHKVLYNFESYETFWLQQSIIYAPNNVQAESRCTDWSQNIKYKMIMMCIQPQE